MKKNEAINFDKLYHSSICLDSNLNPVKLLDCVEQDGMQYFLILLENGTKVNILCTEPLVPLRGRLKNRDYEFVENRFHLNLRK